MGYTNYWHQHNDFTDEQWKSIKEEYDYIKEVCENVIKDETITTAHKINNISFLFISSFDFIIDTLRSVCSKPNKPKDDNKEIYVTKIENKP